MTGTAKVLSSLFVTCAVVWAQGSTAQINGTIKDATGLAVPGAEVKVTQTATGAIRTVTSAGDGGYVLPNLPIGPYTLEVVKSGFNKYVQSGIVLQVDSNPTIDAALQVGSTNEQVTVQADAALVETHSTGIGQVVDAQRVVELPLNGRNPTELIFLAGMANVGSGAAVGTISSVRNYPTVVVSVAGGIGNGNTYLLDGANHNDAINNLNLPLPFPDALQEFKVETSALPAQYGLHSAAAINAVTKSGANAYHGDAFEFLRNGDFNARDFFATSRDTLKRSQFGGTIGGPVLPRFRNKLFFFTGYQGTIQKSSPPSTIAFVPTSAMLNGDFTQFASPACNGGKQLTLSAAQGFVGNQISPSRFNPAALNIESHLPVATDPCGKVIFGLLSNSTENLGVSRIDYQKSEKHSLFGRLTVSNLDAPTTYDGKNGLTDNTSALHDRVYSLAIGDTYLIGTNIVSSFRIGANRTELPKIPDDFASWKSLGVNAVNLLANNPRITISGNGFTIGGGNDILNIPNTGPNPNVAEDLSWVRGAHQLGFGANFMRTSMNLQSGINATGLMTFNGTVTGAPLADFLVGQAVSWAQGNPNYFYNRQHYIALYAQDTWKVNSRLTVNYGVRWEPYLAIYSKYGLYNHFDQSLFNQNVHSVVYPNAPAGEIFPGDSQYTAGNGVENMRLNKFVPRIGLVWDPRGDGKMTVRAAYGMFTDRANIYSLTAFGQDAPYGNVITLANVNLSNPWANYPGGNPLPIALTKNITFPAFAAYVTHPLNFQPTYLHQWNLSVQRQVGTNWLVTANYLGNSTIHLMTAAELNPAVFLGTGPCTIPGPNGTVNSYPVCSTTANTNQRRRLYLQNPSQGQYYSIVAAADDGGTASYEALFLSVQKRLGHGTSLLANYTWSHCISDVWNVFTGNNGVSGVTPGNRRNDRSNCALSDQRQVFNLSAVATSPEFGARTLRLLASRWQISGIINAKSAQFFTVITNADNALNGETAVQRPNLVNTNPYASNQGPGGWILPSAFSAPAPGTYGNLGANNLKGPGVFQFDVSLSRTFRLREAQTIQLRAEAFNVLNHVNFSIPVATLNSGNFGQITSDISGTQGLSAGDPRIVQLALKYVF
ncbi:MAG TPA: carboxypeptidase regulatory-like domain-containing protein [Bryobacteraceae bacterium]|nr:carboxypeptidase regulatory-like domain-containing protein [Bryobacteraceae bacterium]